MIRIEASERLDFVTLVLSGRIQAEDLPELEGVMESYSQPVVLNLAGIQLVDREAVRFLADFEAHDGRITRAVRTTFVSGFLENARKGNEDGLLHRPAVSSGTHVEKSLGRFSLANNRAPAHYLKA
jgi:hypothetical protein